MTGAPFAPWAMRGETVAAFVRRRGGGFGVADGLAPAHGPALLVATRYTASPVGPFLELSVAVPARLGIRYGWCLVYVVTDKQDARIGHRLNWGYPTEVGRLRWFSRDDERQLVWDDRDVIVRARGRGPAVPMGVPIRSLQQRGDGPVVVPGHLYGRMRSAKVSVQVYPGDELAWLAGSHTGVHVAGLNHVIREARQPAGLMATLRAPNQAPEAALRDPWLGDAARSR